MLNYHKDQTLTIHPPQFNLSVVRPGDNEG